MTAQRVEELALGTGDLGQQSQLLEDTSKTTGET